MSYVLDGVTYTLNTTNKTATVRSYNSVVTDIIIPSVVTRTNINYNVISINANAFIRTLIKSITIPNSVTGIGVGAFISCSNLETVTIVDGSNIVSIGESAFQSCGIKSITIPNSVTSIGVGAFISCLNLETVTIVDGSNIVSIGDSAFNSSGIKSITIPNSVTSIGSGAFANCLNLETVTIVDGSNKVSNKVTIGSSVFYQTRIKSITIPNSVTSIGSTAFSNCLNLETVTIVGGSNTVSIGNNAFQSSGIKSITIPNSVTSIGTSAFVSCLKLETVTIVGGINTVSIGDRAFRGCIIKSITIPNSVTSIGSNAFICCLNLETVTIVDGTNKVSIGNNTFDSSGIKSITIPNSVTSIGTSAFVSCFNLETVTIVDGSNIVSIGTSAFSQTRIKSITIPNSVTSIGSNAFSNCFNLETVTIVNGTNKVSIGDSAFSFTRIKSITIPNSVTSIGLNPFFGCRYLESVTIVDGINAVTIGNQAFSFTRIKSITIPNSVTSIGSGAFANCLNLTSATIVRNNLIFNASFDTFLKNVCFIGYNGNYSTLFPAPSLIFYNNTVGYNIYNGVPKVGINITPIISFTNNVLTIPTICTTPNTNILKGSYNNFTTQNTFTGTVTLPLTLNQETLYANNFILTYGTLTILTIPFIISLNGAPTIIVTDTINTQNTVNWTRNELLTFEAILATNNYTSLISVQKIPATAFSVVSSHYAAITTTYGLFYKSTIDITKYAFGPNTLLFLPTRTQINIGIGSSVFLRSDGINSYISGVLFELGSFIMIGNYKVTLVSNGISGITIEYVA